MSNDLKKLIVRFWSNTASNAEKQLLDQKLEEQKDVIQHILLEQFDDKHFTTGELLTETQSQQILTRLHQQISPEEILRPRFSCSSDWISWLSAAVLVIIAGWSAYKYLPEDRAQSAQIQQSVSPSTRIVDHTNTGSTDMAIVLDDGSSIKLSPNSSVSYYEPFGKVSRSITLNGEAFFSVAKDTAHPFEVAANGFVTIALGTKFRVRAPDSEHLAVQLLEGRVVVRSMAKNTPAVADQYLKPGQEFSIDLPTKQVRISNFGHKSTPVSNTKAVRATPATSQMWSFSREPLGHVFDDLSRRFAISIDYNPADVQGLSFTGSFNTSDSLHLVLQAVCDLNNLSFQHEQKKVSIRKSP
jgi:transmembrane sensor